MRIMLTVLGEQGDRDVVLDGDDDATVAAVSEALAAAGPLAPVVRLPRARAPYGMSAPPTSPHPTTGPLRARPGHHGPSGPGGRGLVGPPAGGRGPGGPAAGTRDPGGSDSGAHGPDVPPHGGGAADALGRSGGAGSHGVAHFLWRDGRPLDPRAPARAVLRDGDKVTLDERLARLTVVGEPAGVAEIRVVGGPAAGTVHRVGLGAHVIGSDPRCAIAVPDPELAPEAVIVRVTPAAITVERALRPAPEHVKPRLKGRWADEVAEMSARVAEREAAAYAAEAERPPPELGAQPVSEAVEWPGDELLSCGSSLFTLTAIEPRDAHLTPRLEGGVAYNRPPRLRRPDGRRTFKKPKEPVRSEGMRLQLLTAFLPAVIGVALAYVLQQWYFLLFALMTPVIMIGQWWSDRRHGKKQHRKAMKEYHAALAAFEEEVEAARAEDERRRRSDSPDPAQVLLTAIGPRRRLWERRIHDDDALRLRIGLADLPAGLELSQDGGEALEPPLCRAVPVCLPMRRLGVAGVTGPRDVALGLATWLVGQAATLHSPRDLAIVIISARPDSERRWGWARWLPHCAPRGGEDCVALIGSDPETAARRVAELAGLIDERQKTTIPELGKVPTGWDDLGGKEPPAFATFDVRPYDVLVIVDGAQALRSLPGMPQVLRQGPRAGVYTLAIDEDQRLLPEECATVAACGPDGRVALRGGGLDMIGPVLSDLVSPSWCDRLARSLAPIRDVSRQDDEGVLPDAVRLLDLLGIRSATGRELTARWRDRGSTDVVIGMDADGPFAIDLVRDGPHALIAGTTGAGKSELLQTLICALAVANRPDQLTFVLIDYKGGAAFKECVRLPHTVGMVSDLDGHLTQRALDSLAAELRRRERMLFAAGAKDIDDYAGAEPMPRLVLIIDEFAALVAELPDFVTGLVDIARRGRSLGIHLILATQRPAGVVTADIQANTSLRIALRVTEPAESADIIEMPDAAHISKNTPGRCYVRSGMGTASAVQTARVGGRAPAAGVRRTSPVRVIDVGWRAVGRPLPRPPEPEEEATITDLALVTDALIEAAQLAGVPPQPSPWLEPLPTQFVLPLPGSTDTLSSAAGVRPIPSKSAPPAGVPGPDTASGGLQRPPTAGGNGADAAVAGGNGPRPATAGTNGSQGLSAAGATHDSPPASEAAASAASGATSSPTAGTGSLPGVIPLRSAGVPYRGHSSPARVKGSGPSSPTGAIPGPSADSSAGNGGRGHGPAPGDDGYGAQGGPAPGGGRLGRHAHGSAASGEDHYEGHAHDGAIPGQDGHGRHTHGISTHAEQDTTSERTELGATPERTEQGTTPGRTNQGTTPEGGGQAVMPGRGGQSGTHGRTDTSERSAISGRTDTPHSEDVFTEVQPLPFGVTDRPWQQDRQPLALDLAHGGHLLIAGAARSGRSTALRTIAGSIAAHASPSDVHLHAIDCGSGALLPLVALPHCGAVVTRDQLDRVERLLGRLRSEIGRRQQLLAEAGHASLAEYRQAGHRLPWMVFMLDRWEGFVAAFEGYDYGRLIEALLQLLREGPAVGFRGVITSDRSGLLGQVSTVFDDRLLLRLSDPSDYGLAGLPVKGLPSSIPPGRALSLGDHGIIEHHIALLAPDPAGPAQVAALQALARTVPDRMLPPAHDADSHEWGGDGTGAGAHGHAMDGHASGAHGRARDSNTAGAPVHATSPHTAGAHGRAGDPATGDGRGGNRAMAGGSGAGGRIRTSRWPYAGEPPLRVDPLPMRITAAEALDLDPSFTPPSPLWALIGAGGDALAPLGLDLLAHGPGAVIAGPSRSGRSSALLTAAQSLIANGTPVIVVAPRRSPLRDLEGALAILGGDATNLPELVAEQQEYVVLVDDAELVNPDSPLGTALEEVLRSGRDGDHGLLIAGTTGDLAVAYRGFAAETRKSRTGVLLSVQGQADGDLFNIRLPRGTTGGPPGRGLLVTTGNITPVQAALPSSL